MGNPGRGARFDAIQHIAEIRTKKFSIGKKVPNPFNSRSSPCCEQLICRAISERHPFPDGAHTEC